MDSNTFLLRFGLDPGQFELSSADPEFTEGHWVYYVETRTDPESRRCPTCHRYDAVTVHDRRTRTVRCHAGGDNPDLVRVAKARFLCSRCRRTFTPGLKGVARRARVSDSTLAALREAFLGMETFRSISRRFGIDASLAIRLFDRFFPHVPGRPLPRVLCMDEVLFLDGIQGKYPAVLYDFERREVVDVVRSRQAKWLEPWFASVPEGQRKSVGWLVTDMYDEYARIARRYLPNAVHAIDLFHVVKLLSEAVKRLRTDAMNRLPRDSPEYGFMKSKWKVFQIRESRIPARYYTHMATGLAFPFHEILLMCLKASPSLWEAWSSMQEMLRYGRCRTWTEASDLVERVASRLISTGNPLLESVGRSYRKWRAQIANGIAANQAGRRLSNGVAEGLNSRIKTLKRISNGCINFERFRKRVLLIMTYGKGKPE